MAQIFVSHSKEDEKIVKFFGTIFGSTQVKAIYKEFEGFKDPEAWVDIQRDISRSNAIFILLSENVQSIRHTRDWVVWESALASPMRKDIWLFEPFEVVGSIDVIIPHVDHYFVYEQKNEYQTYIKKIVESYDDSQVLPATLIGAGIGAICETLITKGKRPPILGTIVGGIGGTLLADPSKKRPKGIPVKCSSCNALYNVHMRLDKIRCPICNAVLGLDWSVL